MDTSFLIRLYDPLDPDHPNARTYFEYFLTHSDQILLSTIVAAEYGIGGPIDSLPFDAPKVRIVPFNLDHARFAATLASFAFQARRKGSVVVDKRVVIPNDTKILAQAQIEQCDYFLARDANCQSVFSMLKEADLLTYVYLDLRTPLTEFIGELPFPEGK